MLVVKVEIWPGGYQAYGKELGRVFIANESDLADESNYSVRGDFLGADHLGIEPISKEFMIEGHNRNQSVVHLLEKVFAEFSEPQKTED